MKLERLVFLSGAAVLRRPCRMPIRLGANNNGSLSTLGRYCRARLQVLSSEVLSESARGSPYRQSGTAITWRIFSASISMQSRRGRSWQRARVHGLRTCSRKAARHFNRECRVCIASLQLGNIKVQSAKHFSWSNVCRPKSPTLVSTSQRHKYQ